MSTIKKRVPVCMDMELYEKVENYKFEHHFNYRSDAICDLIKVALEYIEKNSDKVKKK